MKTILVRAIPVLAFGLVLASCATTRPDSSSAADGSPPRSPAATSGLTVADATRPARKPIGTVRVPTTAFPAALPSTPADENTMVAHFIDVGQGDAVLLEFSCGAVLVDTGGEETQNVSGAELLANYLTEFFTRRTDLAFTLSAVVISHPHKDHTAGVDTLLNLEPSLTIENVIDNGATDKGSGIGAQKRLQAAARSSEAGYVGVTEAAITSTGGMTSPVIDPVDCDGVDPKLTVLWGRVDMDTGWANDANNDSVVLRVDFGSASFLFTGDIEEAGQAALLDAYSPDPGILDVDVLKVAHHGSRNGTTAELVAAVSPRIAVIQSGDSSVQCPQFCAYNFGHPNEKAVKLLADPQTGVSMSRPELMVRVGVRGKSPDGSVQPLFKKMKISRAIYDTAWDGNIAVIARADGTLTVETGF